MTIRQAKKRLKEKRALLNATIKEIAALKKYIVSRGGKLDKVDNSERNLRIWRDKEAGKSTKALALTYKLSEESIRRIYARQARKAQGPSR